MEEEIKTETTETNVDTDTEDIATEETEVEETKELTLDDPFATMPEVNEDSYEEMPKDDPVELYRKGLKEGYELNKEPGDKEAKAKQPTTDDSRVDPTILALQQQVEKMQRTIESQEEEKRQQLETRQSAYDAAQSRNIELSYVTNLQNTLAKVGLAVTPQINQGLNNMLTVAQTNLGRALTPSETKEVTKYHYDRLLPWIRENAGSTIEEKEVEVETNLGGAGNATTPAATKKRQPDEKAREAANRMVEAIRKGELSQDEIWETLNKVGA